MIIDMHTHAFPDSLAEKAMSALQEGCNVKAFLDGRIGSLLKSMDEAGIAVSVICSIATKPGQFFPIMEWSKTIVSDRIIPFLSIHPLDDDIREKVRITSGEGFKGIKMHPYYQGFRLDDRNMYTLYEEMTRYNLILISHTGFDMAFPHDRICDPQKIIEVAKNFPDLKFVATHFGSWMDWEEVESNLIGKNIHIETSFSIELMGGSKAKELIGMHPPDYLLFGTDSPWTDQKKSVDSLKSLNLGETLENKIFYKNAKRLLNI